jgi:hypothetical protein
VLNTGLVLLFDQHQYGVLDHYKRLVANCLLRDYALLGDGCSVNRNSLSHI